MRYARNVKIFRGGVDAAPFAGLFFVVLLFLVLFYSHALMPGVPIRLAEPEVGAPEVTPQTIRVLPNGQVRLFGREIESRVLPAELKRLAQRGQLPRRVIFEVEPGADPSASEAIENQLLQAGVAIKLPGSRLELPDDAGFAGAPNPVAVVGVNLNGQVFFEHQLISESALLAKLTVAVGRAREPLTLILQADGKVPAERLVRMAKIAREAGIAEMRIATKPFAPKYVP